MLVIYNIVMQKESLHIFRGQQLFTTKEVGGASIDGKIYSKLFKLISRHLKILNLSFFDPFITVCDILADVITDL